MAFQRLFNKPQTGLASLGAEESIDANADGRVTFWEFARAVADGPAATTLQNFVTRFRDRAAKQSLLWSGMHIPPNRPCVGLRAACHPSNRQLSKSRTLEVAAWMVAS